MTVICINDKGRPSDVPLSNWIKEGQEYTVKRVGMNKLTQEEYFVLHEIQPTPPYGGYKVERFKLPHPQAIESQYERQAMEVLLS